MNSQEVRFWDGLIAAGSLFTSCVENTEPAGIKDLRGAKADYLAALSNLRAADAEKVKAEATLVQAQAATEQARAALQQAKAKEQELINNKKEADDEIAIQKARKDAEVYLAQQEQVLAKAEEDLRAYLVKVEEQSKQLTTEEYQIVVAYTTAYNTVVDKQKGVRDAESYLYSVTYDVKGQQSVEAQKAAYEQTIAEKEASIATNQAKYDEWSSVAEDQIAKYDFWAAEYQKLQDSINDYGYDIAKLQRDSAIAVLENKEAINNFFKELKDAQEEVQDVVDDAKAFSMVYSYYSTPKNPFVITSTAPVVDVFKNEVNNKINETTKIIVPGQKGPEGETYLSINFQTKEDASTIIFGDEEDGTKASLAGIIDALKRDSVVVDRIINDTTGLGAAVAAVKAEYEAVKDTLEKGVAAYKPIADSVAATKAAKDAYDAAELQFKTDTSALMSSIKVFVDALNTYNNTVTKKAADSEKVFNAFVAIMAAREKALEYKPAKGAENLNFFKYYKPEVTIEESTPVVKPVKDSVKFSSLEFAGIKANGKYAGIKKIDEGYGISGTPFQGILRAAFGCTFFNDKFGQEDYAEIKLADLASEEATNCFMNLFYNEYAACVPAQYVDIVKYKGEIVTGWDGKWHIYQSQDVKDAKTTWDNAKEGENKAKDNFYKNIYCYFWGVDPEYNYDVNTHKLKTADSLKIRYSEKTFTDPYVIPVFTAINENEAIFTPAKGKVAAKFEWSNLKYNDDNAELVLIESKVKPGTSVEGWNNFKNGAGYTLYAKTLAAEQIAGLVEDYKENTKALAELEEVVAEVELAYAAAVLEEVVNKAAADSAVTAYLGEDIVEAALEDAEEGTTATDLWTADLEKSGASREYVVDVALNTQGEYKLKSFTAAFCEAGEYKLGGQQLEAAEANIPHYAEVVYEHNTVKEFIKAATDNCTKLSEILKTYVDAVAKVEGLTTTDDPEKVAATVKNYFKNMLQSIQGEINNAKEDVAKTEALIKKLEAGYDTTQVTIDYAKDLLAKAQQALEQAEVEFAVAKAAYEAVLANHGVTE